MTARFGSTARRLVCWASLWAAVVGCSHAAAPAASSPPLASEAWRAHPPKGGPPAEIKLPEPHKFRLSNQLEVLLVEDHTLPLLTVQLVVFAGAERTTPRQAGLADLVAALLDEGTKSFNALGLADALEEIGAELKTTASYDAALVALSTLKDTLPRALELFSEVVSSPRFPDKEIDRVRQERLTAIEQEKDQPAAMLRNTLQRAIYGENHPYAYPLLGLGSTLKSFKRSDIERFWRTYYVPNNSKLIVVGDTTTAELKPLLESRLVSWKPKSVRNFRPPAVPKDPAVRKVYWVERPSASQSVVAFANVGAARNSPDHEALLVMNHILGGAFSSRINMNLRERRGWSYGARSSFVFLRSPGPFFAGGNVRGDVTKESLAELMREIENMRTGSVTQEELEEAKSSIIGKMPARFETQGAIAAMLAELVVNGLPLDWYRSFSKRVSVVTAKDVQRVAQTYARPQSGVVVVVGDPKLGPAVGALELGPIEVRGPLGEKK